MTQADERWRKKKNTVETRIDLGHLSNNVNNAKTKFVQLKYEKLKLNHGDEYKKNECKIAMMRNTCGTVSA